jgi:hypothetical protein
MYVLPLRFPSLNVSIKRPNTEAANIIRTISMTIIFLFFIASKNIVIRSLDAGNDP